MQMCSMDQNGVTLGQSHLFWLAVGFWKTVLEETCKEAAICHLYESHPWDLYGGRRELAPAGCSLTCVPPPNNLNK